MEISERSGWFWTFWCCCYKRPKRQHGNFYNEIKDKSDVSFRLTSTCDETYSIEKEALQGQETTADTGKSSTHFDFSDKNTAFETPLNPNADLNSNNVSLTTDQDFLHLTMTNTSDQTNKTVSDLGHLEVTKQKTSVINSSADLSLPAISGECNPHSYEGRELTTSDFVLETSERLSLTNERNNVVDSSEKEGIVSFPEVNTKGIAVDALATSEKSPQYTTEDYKCLTFEKAGKSQRFPSLAVAHSHIPQHVEVPLQSISEDPCISTSTLTDIGNTRSSNPNPSDLNVLTTEITLADTKVLHHIKTENLSTAEEIVAASPTLQATVKPLPLTEAVDEMSQSTNLTMEISERSAAPFSLSAFYSASSETHFKSEDDSNYFSASSGGVSFTDVQSNCFAPSLQGSSESFVSCQNNSNGDDNQFLDEKM